MKVINAIFSQGIGGVNQVFKDYSNILAKSGHDVRLLISDNGFDDYDGFKKYKLSNKCQFLDLIKLLFIILKFRPDVVICHSNRIMCWMKMLNYVIKVKAVAINHGISFKKSLSCQYIININQQIHDLVLASGFALDRSFIVNNAINVDVSYQKKSIDNIKIGIFGRYEPRKGFDILFKAAEILKKQNLDLKYKIAGFSTEESLQISDIKNFAKEAGIYDSCEFYGVVKNKADFFKDLTLLIVPSREEPFGLVILEGFLHSTLVISSNTDGGNLMIDDNKNGLLFENSNPHDLANKIEYVIANKDKYYKLTKKAYEDLEKRFSYASLTSNLNRVLEIITSDK